jgi:hypothetical protein
VRLAVLLLALLWPLAVAAQTPAVWLTDKGTVKFHADSPMQAIDATSTVGTFVYDGKGGFVGSVAMSSFEFTNGLLRSHFNESYLESDKPGPPDAQGKPTFPNQLAVVTGKLVAPLDVSKSGPVEVSLKARFTCHGVTLERVFRGTVTLEGDTMALKVKFDLAPKDFGIPLPTIGEAPMFQTVEVTVEGTLRRQPG